MTDLVPTAGPAPWAEYAGAGQEDVDARDLKLPRLKLDKTGTFINSVTNENLGADLNVVVLGLIKQRTFFPKMTGDAGNSAPICKSNDFKSGFPAEPFVPKQKLSFPWQAAQLNAQDHPMNSELGRVVIACETCYLKEWRDKTFNDDGKPYCAAMHTYPLLYQFGESWMPAVMSVKGSSMKSSTAFISSFASQGSRPFFTAYTRLHLNANIQSEVEYATVTFTPDLTSVSDQALWPQWFEQLKSISEMLRTPPRPFEQNADGSLVDPDAKRMEENQANQNFGNEPASTAPAWAQYVQPDQAETTQPPVPVASPPQSPAPVAAPAPPPAQAPVAAPTPAPMSPAAPVSAPAPAPNPVPLARPVAAPAPRPPAPQAQPVQPTQPAQPPMPAGVGNVAVEDLPF